MKFSPLIRMFRMDCLNAITLIFGVLAVFDGTSGQTASVSVPVSIPNGRIQVGSSIPITCTVNGGPVPSTNIQWLENAGGTAVTLFNGEGRFSQLEKYNNFNVTSLSGTESVMTIHNADVGDDGDYTCAIPTDSTVSPVNIEVEAPGTLTGQTLRSIVNSNGEDMYEATCDLVGSKPQVDIIWILNGVTQTGGNRNTIENSNPLQPSNPPLSNTRSVFTFPATQENYGQNLVCQATGYQLTDIDLQDSTDLDIHSYPSDAGTTVTADYVTQGSDNIRVTCTAQNEPTPTMRNYYIFSNGTLIHESTDSVKDYTVSIPPDGTEFTCMAGNYLGNTSLSAAVTYDRTRTTTPPPTTAPITTEGVYTTSIDPTDPSTEPVVVDRTPSGRTAGTLGIGAIIGIVIGALIFIALIIVLIVVFVVKPDCIGGSGPKTTTSSHKHSSSAVGSSNGNEKEKIRPEAAPRGHSSIKHTTDNPNQDMYAMVDKKPAGRGDSTDARGQGPGQNEQPGMHYADLDLTAGAGHSDRVVPKNEDGVVVYSSILV